LYPQILVLFFFTQLCNKRHRIAVVGQYNTLSLSCHNANWREHAESKASSTDALPTHAMI